MDFDYFKSVGFPTVDLFVVEYEGFCMQELGVCLADGGLFVELSK